MIECPFYEYERIEFIKCEIAKLNFSKIPFKKRG